jgi:hypothetical protein
VDGQGGVLTALEGALLEKPWAQVRPDVRVKLLAQEQELYVFAESRDRIAKERSMRRRQLKWLWRGRGFDSLPFQQYFQGLATLQPIS